MNSAKNVLFNLNTIESIMLTSTIMVNLSGIMLLSGKFENLEPGEEFQRDIFTYTIILVISTSFFILFCSLVREIHLARQLGKNMVRARWRAVIRKQMAINKKKRAAARRFQNTVYDMMRKHNVGKLNQSTYLASNTPAVENTRRGGMNLIRQNTKRGLNLLRKQSVAVKPIQEEVQGARKRASSARKVSLFAQSDAGFETELQMSDANLETGEANRLEDDNANVRVPAFPLFPFQYTVVIVSSYSRWLHFHSPAHP
jgi:hypothetical protein